MSPTQEKKETDQIMKKIIIALALLLSLAACNIEHDQSIEVQEMMSIQSGLLVNDLGIKYYVAKPQEAGDLLSEQRVFMYGTAVPSEVSGYEYVLTPYEWYSVMIKDCVKKSTVEDVDETLGTSPVCLNNVWVQGDYLNALTTISYDSTEENASFVVNMMLDDERSDENTLYFVLKNKQTGKTWEDEELSSDDVVFGSQFMSFPIKPLLAPGFKGNLEIYFEWDWFVPGAYEGSIPTRTVTNKQWNIAINFQ